MKNNFDKESANFPLLMQISSPFKHQPSTYSKQRQYRVKPSLVPEKGASVEPVCHTESYVKLTVWWEPSKSRTQRSHRAANTSMSRSDTAQREVVRNEGNR
ncbi:unnamed protein product [Caenorhabditis nigoni]